MRVRLTILSTIFFGALVQCNSEGQERTTGAGYDTSAATRGQTDSAGDDSEDDAADEPVQVTGAYLTLDYIPDLPDKKETEISVGGHVEKDGVVVDLSQMTASGQVQDVTSNAVVLDVAIDVAATDQHYKFNIPKSSAKNLKLVVTANDGNGRTKKMERKMDDMGGSVLPTLTPDRVFDFASLTIPAGGLSASNFCDTNGPLSSVVKDVSGAKVTIAAMEEGVAEPVSKDTMCFHKFSKYVGSGDAAPLKPSEKMGDYVGSGSANGGNIPCLFLFAEKLGADAVPTRLYILKDPKTGLAGDLRRTAAEYSCP